MNYQEIKLQLAHARTLLERGEVGEANTVIQAMVGKGLTGADLDACLTSEHIRVLREYTKKQKETNK